MSAVLRTGCVVVVEVVGASALRARVPAAYARGHVLFEAAVARAAAASGGRPAQSAARGQLLEFAQVVDAIGFGMALQVDLLSLEWPATLLVRPEAAEERAPDGAVLFRGLRVRIAIHRGAVVSAADEGLDGPAVYQVARVAAVGHGGQVLVTGAAADAVEGPLPPNAVLRDLGAHSLASVDGELRLHQVMPLALDARRFPDLETQRVRRSNVPPPDDAVFGRQGDLAALSELLHLGVRAVAVSGPGGVGKSRLVRQFAATRAADGRFAGGVWFVRVDEPTVSALCRATSWALRVPLDERASVAGAVDQLAYALAARGPLLLAIDAIEAPVPEVRAALEKWLRTAPGLCLLVNSAGRLRLGGEVEYQVRPLQLPTAQNPQRGEGPRIYATRARGIDEDFTVDDPTRLSEVVAATGGLPLAIRLLAGFVDRLPLDDQLARVQQGTLSTAALVDPLIELLDADEFQVLVACSVLPGSFDVRSLLELGEGALRMVDRLERRGLIRDHADPAAIGIHRYTVEPAVAAQVVDRLSEVERRSLRERRATQLVASAEAMASAERADRPELVARLAADWDGLVEAVRIGVDPTRDDSEAVELALRACLTLRPVLLARGPLFIGLELLDAVLRRCDAVLGNDPLLQLRGLLMRAELLRAAGRVPQCLADLERAAALAERWSDRHSALLVWIERAHARLGAGTTGDEADVLEAGLAGAWDGLDPSVVATARAAVGAVRLAVGRLDEAEPLLNVAIGELERQNAVGEAARALTWLALLHRRFGRYDEACALYGRAIGTLRALGSVGRESQVRAELGLVDVHLGKYAEAEEALTEAVALARWSGDRRGEAQGLRHLGLLDVMRGRFDRARQALLEALAIDRDRGDPAAEGTVTGLLGVAHHLGDQLEPARDSYRRACQLLESCGERRMLALFGAWSAALEAERGEHGTARALFETARLRQLELSDPQVGAALHQLRGAIELMEAALAEGSGDAIEAARWRDQARQRWDEARTRESPLPVEARLAHLRVGLRLRNAASSATSAAAEGATGG